MSIWNWSHYAIVEAIEPFKLHPTSMSFIYVWTPWTVVDGHMVAHSHRYHHRRFPRYLGKFYEIIWCKCGNDPTTLIWRLMWGETEGMKQGGGNPSMVPRRGFATEPTWRVQDHSFWSPFSRFFVQPNFGQNFEWTRQIHGTANPGAQEATTLLTVFCFVSACLHRASTQHLE